MTQGICGRTFFDSYVPSGHLSSWESRLREKLAMIGSTECDLIWKEKTTPAGASISRLAPLMRRTSDNDSTGVQSQRTTGKKSSSQQTVMKMESAPNVDSITTNAPAQGQLKMDTNTKKSEESFTRATWATPSARDWKDTPGMATTGTNPDGSQRVRFDQLPRQCAATELSGLNMSGEAHLTGKLGALNPEFSFWLMGFPTEWQRSASRAMQSFRKSRRK